MGAYARRDRGGQLPKARESPVIKRPFLFLLTAGLVLAAAGCSPRHEIHIESDTCWQGTVNGDQYISDCGNANYKVIGTLHCVKLQKNTPTGSLRVRIDDNPWISTAGDFGQIQACN